MRSVATAVAMPAIVIGSQFRASILGPAAVHPARARHTLWVMPNVAHLLSRSAAAYAERAAIKLDDRVLSYSELEEAAARVAGLLRAKGVQPGDRVGVMLPNVPYFAACYYGALRVGAAVVPMNVLLKEREVGYHLVRLRRRAAARVARVRRRRAPRRGARRCRVRAGGAGGLRDAPGAMRSRGRHGRARRRRHGGDPLHVGNHRHAEGRRAHAREPVAQRRGRHRPLRGRRARRHARCAAVVPLLRSDLCAQRDDRRRRGAHPAPALRARQGAGDHRARPRDGVRGRADDVCGDAQRSPGRRSRRVRARAVRLRRRGDAGGAHACVREAVRLPGPRGLRPVGDLTGRLVQPPRPRAQARLDRVAGRRRRDPDRRRRGPAAAAGRGRRAGDPRPQRHEGVLGARGRRPPRPSTTKAGSAPATSGAWTRTATSTSSTARRIS